MSSFVDQLVALSEMRAADTNYRTQTVRRHLRLLVISVKRSTLLYFLLYANNILCTLT